MSRALDNTESVFVSDRDKGLNASLNSFFSKARHRKCLQHLKKNIKNEKGIKKDYQSYTCPKNGKSKKHTFSYLWKFIDRAHLASNQRNFQMNMDKILEINPAAYAYLTAIDVRVWANYTFTNVRSYQHSTSNLVEQEMNRCKKLKIRFKYPLEIFIGMVNLWIRLYREGVEMAKELFEKKCHVTNYAYRYVEMQKVASQKLELQSENGTVTYFHSKASNCDEQKIKVSVTCSAATKTCSAGCWHDMDAICLHGFADLTYRMGKTPIFDAQFWREFVGSRWSVETFCKCYPEGSYIVLPDRELFVDERLRGPVKLYAKKMVGRTREKRYLSASEGGRRHATTISKKERKLMRRQVWGAAESIDSVEVCSNFTTSSEGSPSSEGSHEFEVNLESSDGNFLNDYTEDFRFDDVDSHYENAGTGFSYQGRKKRQGREYQKASIFEKTKSKILVAEKNRIGVEEAIDVFKRNSKPSTATARSETDSDDDLEEASASASAAAVSAAAKAIASPTSTPKRRRKKRQHHSSSPQTLSAVGEGFIHDNQRGKKCSKSTISQERLAETESRGIFSSFPEIVTNFTTGLSNFLSWK